MKQGTYRRDSQQCPHGKLLKDLANQYTHGFNGVYQSAKAYRLITHYHIEPENLVRLLDGVNFGGISLFTDDKAISDGRGVRSNGGRGRG